MKDIIKNFEEQQAKERAQADFEYAEAVAKAEQERKKKIQDLKEAKLNFEKEHPEETRAAKKEKAIERFIQFYKEYKEAEEEGSDSSDEWYDFADTAEDLAKLLIEEREGKNNERTSR